MGSIYVTAIRAGDYQHTSCSLGLKIVVKFGPPQPLTRPGEEAEQVRVLGAERGQGAAGGHLA